MMFDLYFGWQIIESNHLTIPVDKIVNRSWIERLFSWPWKPWIKTKLITERHPDPNIYKIDNKIICHPTIAQQLKAELAKAKAP